MKKNPAKSKGSKKEDIGRVLETTRYDWLKINVASLDNLTLVKTWRDFNTGTRRAS